jgi:hypothetical protein
MMPTPSPTPTLAATKATRSSRLHPVAVTLLVLLGAELASAGSAHAQKPRKAPAAAEPDPKQVELEQRLADAEAARQAAVAAQAEQEKKIAAQEAQLQAQADAQAAQGKRLDAMEKQLGDEARARAEAEARVSGVEKKTAATPPAVGATRLGIGITGFAQADWQMRQSSEDEVVDSTGEPKNDDRFLLRRARLKLTADYGHVLSAVELDANTSKGSQVRVVDAELSFQLPGEPGAPPLLLATTGLFKIPFGYEVVQSDKERLFMERSNAERALFPGEYDVGARVAGGWRFLRWALAVQNGDPLGEKGFPGRDPNAAKDLTGHVGVDAKLGGQVGLAGGFSALTGTGFHKGTPQTKDILVWSDVNENGSVDVGEIQVKPGQAATASQGFDRFAVGGDLRLSVQLPVLGKLELAGEFVLATNLDRATFVADPVAQGRDLRELGFYVAATQELGERFVIGARYDFYDPDSDASDRQGGVLVPSDASVSTLALDAGLRFEHGRLVGEYQHNRNHLGRDVAGLPTNLDDDAFVLRAQVEF